MKLAILFWIYKEIEVCVNRAQWLRKQNPDTPIYCLYGGPIGEAEQFQERLADCVDDFYVFDEDWDSWKKWLDGDQMLAAWYRQRGASLNWDTVFIAQWDLVLLTTVQEICGTLQQGQLLLPGLRPIAEVEHFWSWAKPGSERRQVFERFKSEWQRRNEFPTNPLCCNFVAGALPREFLARYADEAPETGFLEYKMPVLAQTWGFGFCQEHGLKLIWVNERRFSKLRRCWTTLHAEKRPVHPALVVAHRAWPWGHRAFHPYVRTMPLEAKSA